jgi:hypothetical protein
LSSLDDNLIINIKCAKLLNHHIDSDFMLFMASLLIEDSHSLQAEQLVAMEIVRFPAASMADSNSEGQTLCTSWISDDRKLAPPDPWGRIGAHRPITARACYLASWKAASPIARSAAASVRPNLVFYSP